MIPIIRDSTVCCTNPHDTKSWFISYAIGYWCVCECMAIPLGFEMHWSLHLQQSCQLLRDFRMSDFLWRGVVLMLRSFVFVSHETLFWIQFRGIIYRSSIMLVAGALTVPIWASDLWCLRSWIFMYYASNDTACGFLERYDDENSCISWRFHLMNPTSACEDW